MKMNAFVIGATGLTGCEVIRLLSAHPMIGGIYPISRESGTSLEELHSNLTGIRKYTYTLEEVKNVEPDVVFICLPSGQSFDVAKKFINTKTIIIDLGADFRFDNPELFEKTYKKAHRAKEIQHKFTYGYIEEFKDEIKNSKYISNPGCYVNAALCPLVPLIKADIVNTDYIFISAINGTSGAGINNQKELIHHNQFANMLAYSLNGHRHTEEIENVLFKTTMKKANVSLVTSHGNFVRGIFMIQCMKLNSHITYQRNDILEYLSDYYKNNNFISIIGLNKTSEGIGKNYGIYPQLSKVIGSNSCHISIDIVPETRELRVVSIIDNSIKGAAGTAIQNMNAIINIDEETGLTKYGI
ncbi:N-acetyl-gamma-glutamyl-phosphate reductase [Xenorhabdus siamensis]|uniref:N-acetyl-gamma-glutamyl-phosphate reductase n=1 Tax=Xenorhabdus siamensis TaxID=3136254 RepID=UPI0030F385B6